MIKGIGRLTRAHTVPLETAPALVGGLLATSGQVTIGVVLWGLYGVLYHLTGYGMNSLEDWKAGYDKDDPHKQHHPLNTGEIKKGVAEIIVLFLASSAAVLALALSIPNFLPIVVIVVGVATGVGYNKYGKSTVLKPVLISIAHTTVFVAPYLALGGDSLTILGAGSLMVFSWVFFQIAVSGEIKDMKSDEANILKDLFHCRMDDTLCYISETARVFSVGLRLSIALLFTLVAFSYSIDFITTFAVGVVGLVTAFSGDNMMLKANKIYRRQDCIRTMAQIEIMTMLMFLLTFSGTLELLTVIIFLGSGVWVVVMNKYLWDTWLAPDV